MTYWAGWVYGKRGVYGVRDDILRKMRQQTLLNLYSRDPAGMVQLPE